MTIDTSPVADVRPLAGLMNVRNLKFSSLKDFFGPPDLTVARNARSCPTNTKNAVFNTACKRYFAERD